MLRDDVIDLAFLSVTEHIQSRGLELHRLVTEELVAVLPTHHPLAGRDGVSLAELAGDPFISFRAGSRLRELLDSAAAGAGFEPRIALESNESRRIRSLVSSGLGVAILPRSDAVGAGAPVAVTRLVEPALTRDVTLAVARQAPPLARGAGLPRADAEGLRHDAAACDHRAMTRRRALGLRPAGDRVPRGARAAGARSRGAPARPDRRHAAAARAPARLHARPALGRARAADGRGLVSRPGHRHRRHRPRRQAHLPRPRTARRLPDHAHRRRHRLPAHDGAGDRRGARRRRHRRPCAPRRRARLHRRLDAGRAQDRVDRRPRRARRHDARLRDQRAERPAAVQLGRRLRPRRRADDVGHRGDRRRAGRRRRWRPCERASRRASPRRSIERRADRPRRIASRPATAPLAAARRRAGRRHEPPARRRPRARRDGSPPRQRGALPALRPTASIASRTTGTGPTRSAGAAVRTSATARSGCCSSAARELLRRCRARCCTSRPSGACASASRGSPACAT